MKKLIALLISAEWMLSSTLSAGQPLLLNWGSIDTSVAEQQMLSQSIRKTPRSAVSQRLSPRGTVPWLVQFNDVIREEWKDALTAAGAEIRGYMPENGFLLVATPEQIQAIGTMPDVVYVGEFLPEYKRAAKVRAKLARVKAKQEADAGSPYRVLLFLNDDLDATVQKIETLTGLPVAVADGDRIRTDLTAAQVEEITAWGEVNWVETYTPPRLWNNIAVQTNMMNVVNVWTNSSLGLTGAGQYVAVADTGLDTGDTSTLHPDFTNRVTGFGWISGVYNAGYSWADTDSHGTHVAGSVLGNGSKSSGLYKGPAYEAHLIMQGMQDDLSGLDNVAKVFGQAFDNGARIHSDSWGYGDFGDYNSDSRVVDQFVWSNKTMLIVIAAGNDGEDISPANGVIDTGSVASPSTAKNCLTVGASETYRTSGGYSTDPWGTGSWTSSYHTAPISVDYISRPYTNNIQGLAGFSGRGPCDDGRIKPDIVAPGTDIISTRSRRASDTGWGTVSGNTNYLYMGGTSMATPLTAGAAVLVRQWLVEKASITNPSASLLKALMINGARDMTPGQYGTGSYREVPVARPNNVQGYGHVDLYNTLKPATNQFLHLYDTNSLSTGNTNSFPLTIGTTTGKFIVTMAYADYWGTVGSGKQLINDLDLTVQKPSGGYLYANGRTSKDATNNVEQVEFVPDETGTYTVRIAARTVPSGGSQAYALVVRGYLTSAPSNTPPLLASIGNKSVVWSNTLQFAVTASPTDGDTVTLSVSNAPAGSAFSKTNENGTFIWTNAGPAGVYTMTFYAVDNDGSDSETITVTVNSGSTADDLFISEYIEGSSNNKAVEIFNGTGSSVDLGAGNYDLRLYFNGGTSPTTIDLTNTIANGEVFVIANSSASNTILTQADATSGSLTFNGNDVVALSKNSSNIDVMGTIGVNITNLVDVTKVRKSTVSQGTTTYDTGEWDNYASDTFSYLGAHTFGGGTPSGTNLPVISYSPSGTNHSVTVSNLLTVTVTATDADGDEIVLVDVSLPSGASFPGDLDYSPVSSDFTWTPSVTGVYQAVFEAEDNDGAVTSTIQIVVNAASAGGSGTTLLECDFSSGLPSGWTNIDWLANSPEMKWTFNNPGARVFNASTASNGFAILDSDHYGTGKSQAADLVSPVLDMSGATNIVIRFEHYFRNYSTNDFCGIWYNTDGSLTSYVFMATWDGADTANAATYVSNITALVSGHSQVRFGWYYQGVWDYYWCVDDISITGIVASAGNDSDGDGISDDYELQYSGSITGLVAGANNDTDPFTNYEEYLADTDPTDSNSYFMSSGAAVSLNQVLSFPGSTARMYSLYYRTNILGAPDWTPVFTHRVGTNTTMSVTDTNRLDRVYYRLKVELIP